MGEKKKTMTKDEIIMELMELLKENGKAKQAAEVFECAAYVDMLENKLDQMTNELVQMRKELQEMKIPKMQPQKMKLPMMEVLKQEVEIPVLKVRTPSISQESPGMEVS